MQAYNSIKEIIGKTPLLRLGHLAEDRSIYAKCEFMNPISVKDRPVLQIIEDAEKDGRLKPGSTLIEATSGNTGMAIASIAALKGYRAVLVMSEIQSLERRKVLQAFGAELVLTPASEGTAGAMDKLKDIMTDHPEYFYIGQHVNPSNPKAHYETTGPEIWSDTEGKIDILVAGLGTGGTICGAGRFLKERKSEVRTVAIEPKEAPYISQGIFHIKLLSQGDEFFIVVENRIFIIQGVYTVDLPVVFRCRKPWSTCGETTIYRVIPLHRSSGVIPRFFPEDL